MAKRRTRTTRTLRLRRRLQVERLRERCVLAAITGEVFEDSNESLKQETGELGAAERLVFVDLNRNERLDQSEPFALSDSSGAFEIPGMEPGDYVVRLFAGGPHQIQTLPVTAEQHSLSGSASGGTHLAVGDDHWFSLNSNSAEIQVGNFLSSEVQTIVLDGEAETIATAPDGRLLVLGAKEGNATSWMIDPSSVSAEPMHWDVQPGLNRWTRVSLDQTGKGLAVAHTTDAAFLYRLEYSESGQWVVLPTTMQIPTGTSTYAPESGDRHLIAMPGDDSFEFSLWSQTNGQLINGSGYQLSDISEVLGFSNDLGILITRSARDTVSVFDVDADFSQLNQFNNLAGPAAFDGAFERLATFNSDHNLLELRDVVQGDVFASFEVDLTSVGQLHDLVWRGTESLVLIGEHAVREIGLSRSIPSLLTIKEGLPTDAVLFGTRLERENRSPEINQDLRWSLQEDTSLTVAASELMSKVTDPDGDQLIVLQQGQALHGVATVDFDGAVHYQPNEHFFGTDYVHLRVHDGVTLSDVVTLEFTVEPVADPPSGVVGSLADLHEDFVAGQVLGSVQVLDPDTLGKRFSSRQHEIFVSDPRFEMTGDQLVFVGGELEFEAEPTIELSITAFDVEANLSVTSALLVPIRDPSLPKLSIDPDSVSIEENSEGILLTTLSVQDATYQGEHLFDVDDSRFRVEGNQLFIQPDAVLDYEIEPQIALVVSAAREDDLTVSVQETVVVQLINVPEQPAHLYLTNQTVRENVFGDSVGYLLVDGGSPSSALRFSVDDSRFEVVEGELRLIDQVMVERDRQTQIEIVVTVTDVDNGFNPLSARFVIQVAENANPYHNAENPYDVDRNGSVSALDALAIINYLNVYGPGPIRRTDEDFAYDVNADQRVTSLDVLLVLNEINRRRLRGEAVANGEQIQIGPPQMPPEVSHPGEPPPLSPDAVEHQPVDSSQQDSEQDFGQISAQVDDLTWSERAVDQSLLLIIDPLDTASDDVLGAADLVDLREESRSTSLDLLSHESAQQVD